MATTWTPKEPSEAYFGSFNFTIVLGTETISTATVTAIDEASLEDVSTTVLDVAQQTNSTVIVYAWVRAGTSGHVYLLNCLIVDSAGRSFELDAILPVEETQVGSTVQSLYDVLQYRRDIQVVSDDLVHIVNAAIRAIAKRLYALGSDIITKSFSVAIVIATEDAYGDLPHDFWGMKDKPYVSGKTYPLTPLPSQDIALQYASTGEPMYYKIKGRKIYVIPEASANCTLMGDYFQKPTAVTDGSSIVPFNELFDDLIAEYVYLYFRGPGEKGGNMISILDKLIKDGVDNVALRYDKRGPVQFAQAINWNYE